MFLGWFFIWCKPFICSSWHWIILPGLKAVWMTFRRWLIKEWKSYTREIPFPNSEMWEFLMKAVWVAPNEEDGRSMKQNDENQLSGGGFSLAFTLPCLLSLFYEHTNCVHHWTSKLISLHKQSKKKSQLVFMIMRFLHFYFTYSPLSSPFSLSPQLNCSPSSSVSYKHSFPLLFASRISNAFIKINMMFYFYQGTSAYRCGQKNK